LVGNVTVSQAGLRNGDMIFIQVNEEISGIHEQSQAGKFITKDGNIVALDYSDSTNKTGFRPGMMALRDIKKQWTLREFESLDSQFVYKIKKADRPVCKIVSLDQASLDNFQLYQRNFNFQRLRVGYLYGKFLDDNSVQVEFIYEPPQDSDSTSFTLLPDDNASNVEAIVNLLELRRVGWVVAHPPREEGFFLSGNEIITAAELQLEAANGIEDTPFVTVSVTLTEDDKVSAYGYQVSKMCMEMAAEGALGLSCNLGTCAVNPPFSAIMEGKETKEVDNNFFIAPVPIEFRQSTEYVSFFPRINRDGSPAPTQNDLKQQLSRAGREGWTMLDMLADFQALLFLSNFLDLQHDFPLIIRSVKDRSIPLDEGYSLLIRSFAGLD